MSYALLICTYKRQRLAMYCLEYFKRLQPLLSYDLKIFVVGTNDDQVWGFCKDHDIDYSEHKNEPLNEKWQHAVNCSREYNPDGIILANSDDLLSQRYLENIVTKEQDKLVGISDLFFMDQLHKKTYYWPGYENRRQDPIGAGRYFGKELLDSVGWQLWNPLNPRMNCLDAYCWMHLKTKGIKCAKYKMDEVGHGIDIKCGFNITPIEAYKNIQEVDGEETLELFGVDVSEIYGGNFSV